MNNENLHRELLKIDDVLSDCQNFFEHQARMNAQQHLSEDVFFSPIHGKIASVRNGLKILLEQTKEPK